MNPILPIVCLILLIIGLILGLLTRKFLKTRFGAVAHFVTVEIFTFTGGFLAAYLAQNQKPEVQTMILLVLGGAVLGPVPYLLILRSVNRAPTDRPVHDSPVKADQPSRVKPVPTSPVNEVTKSIFVSYRREDSAYITGRIYDTLTAQFGKSAVFKDVDSIPIGVDFREHISVTLGNVPCWWR